MIRLPFWWLQLLFHFSAGYISQVEANGSNGGISAAACGMPSWLGGNESPNEIGKYID